MQDNNESEESTQNKPTDQHESVIPHVSGDIISPSSGSGETSSEASPAPELKPLNHPLAEVTSESAKPRTPFGVSAEHGKKRLPKKVLLIIAAVVLAIAGAGAWWFIHDKKTANNAQTKTSQELKEVEVIRIGTTDGPANNIFPKEGIGVSYGQNRQIYEGLVGSIDDKYVPLLATSWTNPDEKTWVFKLKPNVKFHTGKTLTATDVKGSLEAIQKIDFLGYVSSTIDKIEVVNDLEIKITTTEPDSLLLNRLALAFVTDQTAKDAEGKDGTGPYTLDKTVAFSESTATLVANDSYHQGRPKTRKLVYTIYESDVKMNTALKENKLDVMNTIPDETAVAGLSEAGFAKIEFESPGTFGLYMNMLRNGSPLKNKEVRKALSQVIDRSALVKELDNHNVPATQVIPKSLPGHDASITFPEFNIAAAKETLKTAGFPNGVTLEFVYIKEIQPDPPILIKQLEAAGFTIKARGFTEVDPALDLVVAGKFDLFAAAYTSDLADSRDLLGAILESTEQSYPVYNDAVYDKLLEDSDRELDPTKRIVILQQANKYIADNLLWIPLRSTAYVTYFKSGLDIKQEYNGGGEIGAAYWKVGQKPTN